MSVSYALNAHSSLVKSTLQDERRRNKEMHACRCLEGCKWRSAQQAQVVRTSLAGAHTSQPASRPVSQSFQNVILQRPSKQKDKKQRAKRGDPASSTDQVRGPHIPYTIRLSIIFPSQ